MESQFLVPPREMEIDSGNQKLEISARGNNNIINLTVKQVQSKGKWSERILVGLFGRLMFTRNQGFEKTNQDSKCFYLF